MKKVLFLMIILSFIFTVNSLGQNSKRIVKPKPRNIFLEGGNDSWNTRQKPKTKITNSKLVMPRNRVKGVTHDKEFENWASRKRKIYKQRRKS